MDTQDMVDTDRRLVEAEEMRMAVPRWVLHIQSTAQHHRRYRTSERCCAGVLRRYEPREIERPNPMTTETTKPSEQAMKAATTVVMGFLQLKGYKDAIPNPSHVVQMARLIDTDTGIPALLTERDALKAEVERLREALGKIVDENECKWTAASERPGQYLECPDSDPEEEFAKWCPYCIARHALEETR